MQNKLFFLEDPPPTTCSSSRSVYIVSEEDSRREVFFLIPTATQILKWIKFCHFYKIYNISQGGEGIFKTAMGILLPFTLV